MNKNLTLNLCGAMLLGLCLAGCGGGDGDAPAPAPVQAPPPPPPPPPPSGSEDPIPPLSATIVNLDDNHQVGAAHWPDGATSTGGTGQAVQGLECLPSMPETYHVHTHVSIFLNGEALAVPGHIGIHEAGATDCFYPIHTHDKSGKLHIEAAAPGLFTLGQFFALWGQTLSSTEVAGLTGMPIVVYLTDNGVATRATGDWQAIELTSHREVTIQVGTRIAEIPRFTWSSM